MTTPESPSSILRRAAERLDKLAADAAPAPWRAVEFYTDCWGVDSAKQNVARENERSDIDEGDARWIAALGPQIAPHLSSILRAEADSFDRDGWDNAEDDWAPLALARALLGETGEGT